MPENHRYTVEDCRRAADSGEVMYAPHELKRMVGELVSRLEFCNYPLTLWRGECGHLWDRSSALDKSDKCPRCALGQAAVVYRRLFLWGGVIAAVIISAALALCPRMAHAQQATAPNSAYVLMVQCNPAAGFQAICFHYLLGIVDGANADTRRPAFCIPPTEVPAYITHVYYRYASKHPELWAAHRADVAYVALKESFPCPSGKEQFYSGRPKCLDKPTAKGNVIPRGYRSCWE